MEIDPITKSLMGQVVQGYSAYLLACGPGFDSQARPLKGGRLVRHVSAQSFASPNNWMGGLNDEVNFSFVLALYFCQHGTGCRPTFEVEMYSHLRKS